MKAVLVNGELHGQVLEVCDVQNIIAIAAPKQNDAIRQLRYFYSSAWPSIDEPAVLVYSAPTIAVPEVSQVYRLQRRLASKDPAVALNEWLDDNLCSELAYNADLRGDLFTARMPWEMLIAETIGRNSGARLKRRFPEVC